MPAAVYNLQRISKMLTQVISSRIYVIDWNESQSYGRKSAQMNLNKPKEPEWA